MLEGRSHIKRRVKFTWNLDGVASKVHESVFKWEIVGQCEEPAFPSLLKNWPRWKLELPGRQWEFALAGLKAVQAVFTTKKL